MYPERGRVTHLKEDRVPFLGNVLVSEKAREHYRQEADVISGQSLHVLIRGGEQKHVLHKTEHVPPRARGTFPNSTCNEDRLQTFSNWSQ